MTDSHTKQNPLEYPYDLFQRYSLTSKIIEVLDNAVGHDTPILEVGGDPGIFANFLSQETPVVVNSPPHIDDEVIPADGLQLPFKDSSFRGTVVLDVLEHIPQAQRQDFLREVDRVSAQWLIVGGPFQHDLIQEAESIVNNLHKQLTGTPHQFLEEHKLHGLPDRQATLEFLQSLGYHTLEIPNGLVCRWMLMMGISVFLQQDPADPDLLSQVFQFVNKNLAPEDNREPAYRHLMVCTRTQLPQEIWKRISQLETPALHPPESDFTAAWEGSSAALQTLIAGKIRERDEQIRNLEGQIRILEEFRDRVQKTIPYRIYRQWKRLWKRP